jgi:hypothetical protein
MKQPRQRCIQSNNIGNCGGVETMAAMKHQKFVSLEQGCSLHARAYMIFWTVYTCFEPLRVYVGLQLTIPGME